MEYLNLEKGGLITILIPLNLLIGEYTLFFRLNGWSRKIIHLITGVIDLFFVVAIIASREHPYYSFVIFGGMLVGIIQSEWCYRKISEETNWSKIDILPESVKFHFYKNKPISVVIFYRLHTNYNQSYRSKGHTTPFEFQ